MVSKEPYHAGDICTLSLVDRMSVGPFCGRQTNIYCLHLLLPSPLGCIFFFIWRGEGRGVEGWVSNLSAFTDLG